jgi:hypothetical protein
MQFHQFDQSTGQRPRVHESDAMPAAAHPGVSVDQLDFLFSQVA